jgi:hypothetical protein
MMAGMKKTMNEWKSGDLHSGSKHGPVVKSQAQAVAIGLSEERKMKHEPTRPGHMGKEHDHHVEQTHKMHGHKTKMDGAGRHGHNESGHMEHSEHKAPHHPAGSHTKQGHDPVKDGAYGYPGEVQRMGDAHVLVGENYKQSDHMPAVLKHEPGAHGFPGIHAALGTKSHGFGHQQSQKQGVLRNSGVPGAHRIGKRD